ncbi:MAG: chromate resistance protein, partial [Chloroflexi bacterium]
MRFVTRRNAAVDRIACPWLIRRFIDPDAEFLYVEPQDVARVAMETSAVPFDVDGAELGHVDGRCSFESILLKYDLDD